MSSSEARFRPPLASIENEVLAVIDVKPLRLNQLEAVEGVESERMSPFGHLHTEISQEETAFSVSAEDWIKIQLLDCQNLAQQSGYEKLVSLLDEALDQLA